MQWFPIIIFSFFFLIQEVLKQDIKKEPVIQFKFRAKFYPEGFFL
jgi:hypothetical protein